jgi:hypothetical protein
VIEGEPFSIERERPTGPLLGGVRGC